jgi:hypothetical protein
MMCNGLKAERPDRGIIIRQKTVITFQREGKSKAKLYKKDEMVV